MHIFVIQAIVSDLLDTHKINEQWFDNVGKILDNKYVQDLLKN